MSEDRREALSLPTAAHIMQRDVVAFTPDQDVARALDVLLASRISGGPVLVGRRVVGMFSERDGLSALAASAYESEPSGTVGHHMRTACHGVTAETDLFALAEVFRQVPVRRLPVLDAEGNLLGLVLRGDLIAALQAAIDARSTVRKPARTLYERVAEHLA